MLRQLQPYDPSHPEWGEYYFGGYDHNLTYPNPRNEGPAEMAMWGGFDDDTYVVVVHPEGLWVESKHEGFEYDWHCTPEEARAIVAKFPVLLSRDYLLSLDPDEEF